ncbi:UNVERIFIED_CONTAM: hypothetical protein FKN15_075427 [Acipenser sinensis]
MTSLLGQRLDAPLTVSVPPIQSNPTVVVPTRVGQVYVYDSGKTEQDEYDIPRQEIYDVPPNRGAPVSQYSQEVSPASEPLLQDVCTPHVRVNRNCVLT